MAAITPQQKSNLGLALTGADIAELLKDPQSWVSKLYTECLLVAEVNELTFIRTLQRVLEEERLERMEYAAERAAHYRREEELRMEQIKAIPSTSAKNIDELSFNLAVPKLDLFMVGLKVSLQVQAGVLLKSPLKNMTTTQRAAHYQQLTTNYRNQVLASMGRTIALPLGPNGKMVTFNVPQLAAKPAASAAQILQRSPGHVAQLKTSGHGDAFVQHVTKTGLGFRTTMDNFRLILEANKNLFTDLGIDIDNTNFTPAKMKFIDSKTKRCQDKNKQFEIVLNKNDSLQLQELFGLETTPAKKVKFVLASNPNTIFANCSQSENIDDPLLAPSIHCIRAA